MGSYGFNDFLDELECFHRRIPLGVLTEKLRRVKIEVEDYGEFVNFSNERYQRNLVNEGDAYQALLLCWKPGQRSPIHDHTESSCAVKILEGCAAETIFERNVNGYIYASKTERYGAGEVVGSEDDDIHQMANLQASGIDLVTLHIYSPALEKMQVYDLEDNSSRVFTEPVDILGVGEGI